MPLVSAVILTHNRANYAVPAIRGVLALLEDIEVVVCDTIATDTISPQLSDYLAGDRFRSVRPNKSVSVVEYFNEALDSASCDYLVFIGDDDFVLREIIDVAKLAKENFVDALKFTFPVRYCWSDFKHRTQGDSISGSIYINPFDGYIRKQDAKAALSAAFENFAAA